MLAIHPVIQPIFERLCRLIRQAGGRPLLVGGCVRDLLLGLRPSDLDLEVYALAAQPLIDLLRSEFDIDLVGRSFGVIKLHHYPIDISLPRRESKVGLGHRGFEVLSDPWMSLEEAAARRDFTINAMAIDPITEDLLDPFNGQRDLTDRMLRHTGPHFTEDPLRVFRGMQFVSRFELSPAPDTLTLCRGLLHEYPSLASERIWGEWEKWATRAVRPSLGLRFLQDIGWTAMYPELAALQGCPQDPGWHPEGDVWTHTLLVVDQAARIAVREGLEARERAVLLFAALCHDLGKPSMTAFIDGHIRSSGHAEYVEPVSSLLDQLGASKELTTHIVALVRHHLSHTHFEGSPRHVRRLTRRLEEAGETLRMLARLVEADASGRPPLPRELPAAMRKMLETADGLQLTEQGPRPILLGRHLIALGIQPGPRMGEILKTAYEAQLDGAFSTSEEGLRWLHEAAIIEKTS